LVGVEAGDGVDALACLGLSCLLAAAVDTEGEAGVGEGDVPPSPSAIAQVLAERDSLLPCPVVEAVCAMAMSRQDGAAS
jgi:hypothetical protein